MFDLLTMISRPFSAKLFSASHALWGYSVQLLNLHLSLLNFLELLSAPFSSLSRLLWTAFQLYSEQLSLPADQLLPLVWYCTDCPLFQVVEQHIYLYTVFGSWGMILVTGHQLEFEFPISTQQQSIQLTIHLPTLYLTNLAIKILCIATSKSLLKLQIASTDLPLCIEPVIFLWWAIKLSGTTWLWKASRRIFSIALPGTKVKLISFKRKLHLNHLFDQLVCSSCHPYLLSQALPWPVSCPGMKLCVFHPLPCVEHNHFSTPYHLFPGDPLSIVLSKFDLRR